MTVPAGKSSLARNTAWTAAAHVVSLAMPVLMIPYVVSRIPLAHYGFWVALSSLAAWFSQYDIGIWGGLTREVAERRARDDREGLRALWVTWLFHDLVLAAGVWTGAFLLGKFLVGRVASGLDPRSGTIVLAWLAGQAVLTPVLRHLMCTLNGLQRMDVANRVALVVTPLSALTLAILVETGWGLPGMAANGFAYGLLQIGILLYCLAREGYPLGVSPRFFSGARLRGLLGFGWKLQATQILSQLFRSDRLLLSLTGSPPARISMYQFGAGLMDRLAGGVTLLSSGILPAASDLAARGEIEKVRMIFLRGTKYHALAAVGLLGFAALFAEELMVFWMGRPLPESVRVLRIMALGGILTGIGSCAQAVGVALGKPGLTLGAALGGLAATVLLYITWGRRYDYEGLAGAVSLGLAFVQIIFMFGMRRNLDFRWREYVGNALVKPAVLAFPLAAVYAGWKLLALPPVDTRWAALAVLAPAFLVTFGLGWTLARAFRVVDDYDLGVLKSLGRPPA